MPYDNMPPMDSHVRRPDVITKGDWETMAVGANLAIDTIKEACENVEGYLDDDDPQSEALKDIWQVCVRHLYRIGMIERNPNRKDNA